MRRFLAVAQERGPLAFGESDAPPSETLAVLFTHGEPRALLVP
jgi:hypothetical protein